MEKLIRILLVDDDIDDREIFLLALNEYGKQVRCRTAGNGVQALRILENSEPPDVIFLDVNMPKMNGLECLEKLRNSDKFDSCRIYVYTTIEDPDILQKSRELKAGCIVKPSSIKSLRQTLREIIEQVK